MSDVVVHLDVGSTVAIVGPLAFMNMMVLMMLRRAVREAQDASRKASVLIQMYEMDKEEE